FGPKQRLVLLSGGPINLIRPITTSRKAVTEKPFTKEEEILANIDKSYSKEEKTFSKNIAVITEESSKSQFFKENKEINEDKELPRKEKSPPKENNCVSENTESVSVENESKEALDLKEDSNAEDTHIEAKGEVQPERTETFSKVNELHTTEGKTSEDEKSKPFSDKVVEENESTLGHDSFSKEKKAEVDDSASENSKNELQISQDSAEIKRTENTAASNFDDAVDTLPSKDTSNEVEDDKLQTGADWVDELPTPTKGRKRGQTTPKQPRREKQPKKPRQASDTPPKTKGRKKAEKFEFDDGEEGNSQRRVAGRTSSRTNRQTRQGLSLEDFIVSDDDEWQSDRSEPKQRRKRGSKRGDDSGSDWEVEHKKSKKTTHKVGSGSESGSDWGSQKKKKGPKGKRRKNKRASEAGSEEEADQSSSQVVKLDKPRIPCTYGKKCYRRHPNHLDQFSHPGDSDYASEPESSQSSQKNDKNDAISESEGESTKKECPYGANCFRKNPQHKKDFKHTKKVRPQREAAKQADKKTKSSRNSDDVDSYDLNDSFLNDDSADEYKPVDSGSDYESGEKMKRFAKGKAAKNKKGKKV
ncbi:micronuclear linker histone polyprotein-like, partial [Stegodyphus dumicola]|uniref:micronuclear linker histone polyprotein-like n=1 Tax=Stegodyphus dumicola TaxID=202533 RepID=UPI0015AEE621